MPQTRIEQLINEIYDFVEQCKPVHLSQSKIVVQKDELLDLVDELRRRTPDEIKRYQKIIANRDTIIAQAEERAKEIEEDARQKAAQLIDETEIMQAAYRQANDMIQKATAEADRLKTESETASEQLRSGILNYAGDVLGQIENILNASFQETRANSERLLSTLESSLSTISSNRREVLEQLENGGINDSDDELGDENFDFPEDTFLNNIDQ